jgi:hypothetical protein
MRPLAVIGNVNVDLILGPAEPWPKAGTEIIVDHDELRVGGAAGNSALAWKASASTSRSPPMSATTSSAAGYAKPSGRGRELAGAAGGNDALRRHHASGRRAHLLHDARPPAAFQPRRRFRRSRWLPAIRRLRPSLRLVPDRRSDADYDAFFDWAEKHRITVALDTGWPLEGWTEKNCRPRETGFRAVADRPPQRGRIDDARRPRRPDRGGPRNQVAICRMAPSSSSSAAPTGPWYRCRMAADLRLRSEGRGRRYDRRRRRLQCCLPRGSCRGKTARCMPVRRLEPMWPRAPFQLFPAAMAAPSETTR